MNIFLINPAEEDEEPHADSASRGRRNGTQKRKKSATLTVPMARFPKADNISRFRTNLFASLHVFISNHRSDFVSPSPRKVLLASYNLFSIFFFVRRFMHHIGTEHSPFDNIPISLSRNCVVFGNIPGVLRLLAAL